MRLRGKHDTDTELENLKPQLSCVKFPNGTFYLPDLVMTISVPHLWNSFQSSAASRQTLGSSSDVSDALFIISGSR